jgi:hypothetical protein
MIMGRVGDGARGLNASLLPRELEDGLHGCNGRLMCLVVVGTDLTPLMVGKASPALRRFAFIGRYWCVLHDHDAQ